MKKRYQKKKNKFVTGFMVIEVLIAVSIIAASILASMAVAQKSVHLSRRSLHETQASFLLEEGAEAIRILRDNAWTNISSLSSGVNYFPVFSSGTWTLSLSSATVGIFTRTINIQSVNRDNSSKDISDVGADDPGTKLITVTVSWPEGGTTITKTLQFYIMDIFS